MYLYGGKAQRLSLDDARSGSNNMASSMAMLLVERSAFGLNKLLGPAAESPRSFYFFVERNCSTNEFLESCRIDSLAFLDINRSPHLAL
jgi:hypothetical protein